MKFLRVLFVFGGLLVHACVHLYAIDREAFSFTNYDLDVRIEPEQQRLDQPHEYVLKHQRLPGIAPILAGVEVQQNFGHKQSTGKADKIRKNGQEEQHENRGDYSGHHQFLHRVGA